MSELAVKPFRNANENESLYVPAGLAPELIPEPYGSLVSDSYRSFLNNPSAELKSLAAVAKFKPLRNWLNELASSDRFGIIVHYADFFGNIQHEVTTCCTQLNRQRFLRLPNSEHPTNLLSPSLRELYLVTDGIIDSHDAFMTSQFVPFSSLFFDLRSSFPIEDAPVSDLDKTLPFYRADTGDYLVADQDNAFAFCHGNCSFHELGSVDKLLESYFLADLEGTRWNPFPYA